MSEANSRLVFLTQTLNQGRHEGANKVLPALGLALRIERQPTGGPNRRGRLLQLLEVKLLQLVRMTLGRVHMGSSLCRELSLCE